MKAGQIGFSQRIRLDWLEYTAGLARAGTPRSEVVAALGKRLRDKLSIGNDPKRGTRNKAITILTRVWLPTPGETPALREEGLALLQRLSESDRMLVHWCMCMAVYPFFGAVAEATGRLLRLQGVAGAAQVQRRLREQAGERETVARAVRRILRSFIDWGVLREAGEKGIYRNAARRTVDDEGLAVWTVRAMLAATGGGPRSTHALLRGPRLFPFEIALPSIRLLETGRDFEIVRQGFDHEALVALAGKRSDRTGQ